MNKHNQLIKKLKLSILSINNLIERYFTNFKNLKSNFKKGELIKNNRVFFGFSAVVILTLGYFLLPTIYDENIIKSTIKNQVYKKYNINLDVKDNVRYGLIPRPHFVVKDLPIILDKKEIGVIKNFKSYIALNNFFLSKNIEIKDLILNKTDFYLKKNDLIFFEELLMTPPNDNKIVIKNSNIFFQNENDELLFLNKIKNSKFYYDSMNLENTFTSKNEIFNIPYKLIIKNDKFNKEINIDFNSKKIRLNLSNYISYQDNLKKGILDILFVNKTTELSYQIKENSLIFKNDDKILSGSLDFKPFYLKADLNYDGISTKDLFTDESIFIDLIKSEIFNNQNLNANINLKIKDITNINELNNLELEINLNQGIINLSESKIHWKDDLIISMQDGILDYNDDGIFLTGRLIIQLEDLNNFYQSFQIKKMNRKKLKKIEVDFVYNFNRNKFQFDNIKIDNNSYENVDIFIDNYNSSEKKFFNKIIFKNFVKEFINNYSG